LLGTTPEGTWQEVIKIVRVKSGFAGFLERPGVVKITPRKRVVCMFVGVSLRTFV